MPKVHKIHPVNHTPQNMFDLVADVEAYPEFLPLCEALVVRQRREKSGREMLIADMTAGYKAIRETFTSQVILNREDLIIDVKYLDGPFRYLNNQWKFEADGDLKSNVIFDIDYEFKNPMLGMLMGSMFEIAFAKFTTAFELRADSIYGSNGRFT